MKTRYWVIILVGIAIVVIGIVLFISDSFPHYSFSSPHSFFSGGKYRIVGQINQYEVFRDLLIIILTLAGLTIALFGIGVYLLLRGRIEGIARKEAEKRSEEVQKEVTYQLVLQHVRLCINLAGQNWKTMNDLPKQDGQKVKRKYFQDISINCLRDILNFAEKTLPFAQHRDFWTNQENKTRLMDLKNNLIYYMAHRKDEKDRKDALRYANEIEQDARSMSVPDFHYLDTVAWVLKQFSLTSKDKEKSESIMNELNERTDISGEKKKELLRKYQEKTKAS